MNVRRHTSRTTVAAICTGILLMLLAGLAGTRCGSRNTQEATIILIDTVKAATDTASIRKTHKRHKKKPGKTPPPKPRQRNYRDETVNSQ